jgi:hypothetical protein
MSQRRQKLARRDSPPPAAAAPPALIAPDLGPSRAAGALAAWWSRPQPIERLAFLRITLPLAILGFLSARLLHADEWLSTAGFHVPDLGGNWRQPLYLDPVAPPVAWAIAGAIAVSGLLLSVGLVPGAAGLVFAGLIAYADLVDRLEAFTVSKLAPVLVLALATSPCAARFSLWSWLARRRAPSAPLATSVPGGTLRFFQLFVVTMYCGSGVAKARGDWLHQQVLWTHLHDQYQTLVTYWCARLLPPSAWWVLQAVVLLFETGAPLWFALRWTRTAAVVIALGMHAAIGLMFGPVIWFALLMGALVIGCFAPTRWLVRLFPRR